MRALCPRIRYDGLVLRTCGRSGASCTHSCTAGRRFKGRSTAPHRPRRAGRNCTCARTRVPARTHVPARTRASARSRVPARTRALLTTDRDVSQTPALPIRPRVRARINAHACTCMCVRACACARTFTYVPGRFAAIRSGTYETPPCLGLPGSFPVPPKSSAAATAFVKALLALAPSARMSATAARGHAFMRAHAVPTWLPAYVRFSEPLKWPP